MRKDTANSIKQRWLEGRLPEVAVVVPEPVGPLDDALPVGPLHLHHLVRRFLSRLSPDDRYGVAEYCKENLPRLNVATACSGTDGPLLCWAAITEVLKADMGIDISLNHVFSCESMTAKQQFIQRCFPHLKVIYKDALQLPESSAQDVLSRNSSEASVDIDSFAAGFPCTDCSGLNGSAGTEENRSCVLDSGLRTGSVFHALRSFVMKCRRQSPKSMRLVAWENVPGLATPPVDKRTGEQTGPSNMVVVVHMMREAGYFIVVFRMSPVHFGVPQNRPRLYVLCVPLEMLTHMSEEAALEFCIRGMNLLVGSQLQELGDYLLPHSHAAVRRHYQELRGKNRSAEASDTVDDSLWQSSWGVVPQARGRCGGAKKSQPDWPRKHMKVFAKRGLDWAMTPLEPPGGIKDVLPGLYDVTPREFERLHLCGVRSFPASSLQIVEVSQDLGRSCTVHTEDTRCIGTIFPNARFYATTKARFLLGIEQMHLQSLWFSDSLMTTCSNNLLKSLSGNAFECSCSTSVFFLGLWLLSAQGSRHICSIPPEVGVGDHASEDDLLDSSDHSDDDLGRVWGKRARLNLS